MLAKAIIDIGKKKFKMEIEIPDEAVTEYAIECLGLMTEDMASEWYESNPPENDYEPD